MNETQLLSLAKQFLALKKQVRMMEDELKDIELRIREDLGDEAERTVEGIRISIKPYTTHRFDAKTFAVDAPAVYKQYLIEGNYTRFTIT